VLGLGRGDRAAKIGTTTLSHRKGARPKRNTRLTTLRILRALSYAHDAGHHHTQNISFEPSF
jgi:hypothetical protein